jgi:hypothetical protein
MKPRTAKFYEILEMSNHVQGLGRPNQILPKESQTWTQPEPDPKVQHHRPVIRSTRIQLEDALSDAISRYGCRKHQFFRVVNYSFRAVLEKYVIMIESAQSMLTTSHDKTATHN